MKNRFQAFAFTKMQLVPLHTGHEQQQQQQQQQQQDGAPGLASLPFEMMTQVLRWLSPEDLTVLAVTCKALRYPTKDDSLWWGGCTSRIQLMTAIACKRLVSTLEPI